MIAGDSTIPKQIPVFYRVSVYNQGKKLIMSGIAVRDSSTGDVLSLQHPDRNQQQQQPTVRTEDSPASFSFSTCIFKTAHEAVSHCNKYNLRSAMNTIQESMQPSEGDASAGEKDIIVCIGNMEIVGCAKSQPWMLNRDYFASMSSDICVPDAS